MCGRDLKDATVVGQALRDVNIGGLSARKGCKAPPEFAFNYSRSDSGDERMARAGD